MKIALKYGLLIAAGVIAWLVIVHSLVPNPTARIHSIGPVFFFNLLEIAGIAFGIREKQRESGGVLRFKSGVKTAVSIAVVYGVAVSLFFVVQIALFGPVWLAPEQRAPGVPLWQTALFAFAGLFVGAVVMGIIYGTIISFIVAAAGRRRPRVQ